MHLARNENGYHVENDSHLVLASCAMQHKAKHYLSVMSVIFLTVQGRNLATFRLKVNSRLSVMSVMEMKTPNGLEKS